MKKDSPKYRLLFFLLALLLFLIPGCDKDPTSPGPGSYERGEIISSSTIVTLSTDAIELIVADWIGQIPVDLTYDIEVIKIVYQTIDTHGDYVPASGALYIPLEAVSPPLLSLHHGTVTHRNEVASTSPLLSVEGIVGLLSTSALGYATSIPDYLGYGESEILHPYVHAKSSAVAVIDFLRASRSYCQKNDIVLGTELFLGGYSEGGYVTLATQKEMERDYSDEFDITAVAPMAGPYDLVSTVDTLLNHTEYEWPAYMAFMFLAYDTVYGWGRLNDVIKSPYAELLPGLFDGTHTLRDINDQLPNQVTALIDSGFIADYLNGDEPEIQAAFQENTLLDWAPVAPVRFYHGDADVTVPYQNSVTAVDSLTANGGVDVELVTIPGGTHESSATAAILDAVNWFESFRITAF